MSKKFTKNYIKGSAREVKFDNGGSIINISLNLDELSKLPNKDGYVQLTIAEKQQVDPYGNTHSIYENDYKPKPKGDKAPAKASKPTTPSVEDDESDNLPF